MNLREWIREKLEYSIIWELRRYTALSRFKRTWREKNTRNDTIPVNMFQNTHIQVGTGSYGDLNIIDCRNEHRISIGNYVSIAPAVTFILDAEHYINHISVYPFNVNFAVGLH